MASYLVLRRMVEDKVYEEGEVLTDPSFVDSVPILLDRGFLAIVPDGFSPPARPEPYRGEPYRPSVQEALDAGYSQEAAEKLSTGAPHDDGDNDTGAGTTDSAQAVEPPSSTEPVPPAPNPAEPESGPEPVEAGEPLPAIIDLSGIPTPEESKA